MNEPRRFSLIKPTVNTPFHIDFTWWQAHDNNWRMYMRSILCEKHQQAFQNLDTSAEIDWIDAETAEVKKVDGLQQVLIVHCAKEPDFINDHMTLVDSAFRALLANGNQPLTPAELAEQIGKPAEKILQTLSGPTVYKGMRPQI